MNPTELAPWTILDIASTLEECTPLEQQAYAEGLSRVPEMFLVGAAYGYHRAPGVLWVDQKTYHDTETAIEQKLWYDEDYLARLNTTVSTTMQTVHTRLAELQQAELTLHDTRWNALWGTLGQIMAFTAFNWLTEPNRTIPRVAEQLSMTEQQARTWILSVSIPDELPHFLAFERFILQQALAIHQQRPVDIRTFTRDFACLQSGLLHDNNLEDEHHAHLHITQIASQYPSAKAIQDTLDEQQQRRISTLNRRSRAIGEAALHCAHTSGHADPALHMAKVLILATNEEEQRKVAQRRSLARLRDLGTHLMMDTHSLRAEHLNLKLTQPLHPAPAAKAGALALRPTPSQTEVT